MIYLQQFSGLAKIDKNHFVIVLYTSYKLFQKQMTADIDANRLDREVLGDSARKCGLCGGKVPKYININSHKFL